MFSFLIKVLLLLATLPIFSLFLALFLKISFAKNSFLQRELQIYFDRKTRMFQLVGESENEGGKRSAFFNFKSFQKFQTPQRTEDFFVLLRSFDPKYYGVSKVTNFFHFLNDQSEIVNRKTNFFLRQKKGLSKGDESRVLRLEYMPDVAGNFYLYFGIFSAEGIDRSIRATEIKTKQEFENSFKRWEIFFVFSLFDDYSYKNVERVVRILNRKFSLRQKTTNFKWFLYEKKLVFFTKDSRRISESTIHRIFKREKVKTIFIFNSTNFFLRELPFNFLMRLIDSIEQDNFVYDWRRRSKYSYMLESNLLYFKKWKAEHVDRGQDYIKNFRVGDESYKYTDILSCSLSKTVTNYIKDSIVNLFFEENYRREWANNIFMDVTFSKYIELMKRDGTISSQPYGPTPFFVINKDTDIDIFALRERLQDKNFIYGIKLHSLFNDNLFQILNILKPRFIYVCKEVGENLSDLYCWLRFQAIFKTLKTPRSTFIFEALDERLENSKRFYISPYEMLRS